MNLFALFAFVVGVTVTTGQTTPIPNPCDGLRDNDGVGYMPDETDCARFYQCERHGTTVSSHHLTCRSGLYWNQAILVCDWPANVQCTAESVVPNPCDGLRDNDGVGYMPDETDCARFYQCERHGTTVSSHHLTCPPGLYWNQGVLVCDWPANVQCTAGSVVSVCKPDLYLPFNGTLQDYSGDNVAVEKVGVSSLVIFGSFSSRIQLRIPSFSNMDFGNVLVISFLFKQLRATSNDQAIVTNAVCMEGGSIYITTNMSTVSFRVINDGGVSHELSVSYPNTAALKSVKLTVNNNLMKAEVNSASDQRTFSGNISRSQCGIHVGLGNGYDSFDGQLKALKVSTCIPTTFALEQKVEDNPTPF
ncbi:protein PIF-like [Haliotis rufescens]|uniref:protein PIF-like n=1 Tax=Haliotis rufescens TaxID=6454 RepID=UPI00201E7BA3|nr:protein PIF-like [Haliotis rufescens]